MSNKGSFVKTIIYSFTVSFNKSDGSCDTIGDPYARVYVPNKVKIMNMKVFNLMSEINETWILVQQKLS